MAHSQESKIDNTFTGAMNQVNRLEKVFRSDGLLQKAIEDINGDTSWLDDIRQALSDAYDALESGHQGTTSHMQDESMVPSDEEWSKLLKIPNRKSWEKMIKKEDAPDYNPAKASAGGPGYASMPQQVKLAGDSIWDKEGTNPEMVTITDYEVEERDGMIEVTVEHDGPWTIYTDSGFEKAISDMIGTEVEFSEQGMQEDGRAHLEGSLEMESADLARIKKLAGLEEMGTIDPRERPERPNRPSVFDIKSDDGIPKYLPWSGDGPGGGIFPNPEYILKPGEKFDIKGDQDKIWPKFGGPGPNPFKTKPLPPKTKPKTPNRPDYFRKLR